MYSSNEYTDDTLLDANSAPNSVLLPLSAPKKKKNFKTFIENNGYLSFIFIMLRKLVQMSKSIAEVVLGPLKAIPKDILKAIKFIQLPLYGIYTLIGTIGTIFKLYNVWSGNGPYANKNKSLWQKIKTTIFSGSMQLSDISVFAFTIAIAAGAASLTTPIGYVLLGINAGISVVKYAMSIGSEIVATLKRVLHPEYKSWFQKGGIGALNGYRMADKTAKLGMALMLAGAIVLVALFATNPYGLAIAAGAAALWAATRLIHFFVKKHILAPKIKARDIELAKVYGKELVGHRTLDKENVVDATAAPKASNTSYGEKKLQPYQSEPVKIPPRDSDGEDDLLDADSVMPQEGSGHHYRTGNSSTLFNRAKTPTSGDDDLDRLIKHGQPSEVTPSSLEGRK